MIRKKILLFAMVVFIIAGVIASLLTVGREARITDVLTIFFSGFAAGASLVSFVRSQKA